LHLFQRKLLTLCGQRGNRVFQATGSIHGAISTG
jgi:hypothetical protein